MSHYLKSDAPALILAPMQGLTDAPMRAVQGEAGAFTLSVSEFLRVAGEVPPPKLFHRHVPELGHGAETPNGLPVQVQLLGGHAGRMASAAVIAYEAGARAVDINFGCPAPTVNRHDGGAALLKEPKRIREIVRAVRDALPPEIPVSAKLRLGWDTMEAILENADMAAEGGANWLTIHGRTRVQGYQPPAYWNPIGRVRERLDIPVVANGDLWAIADFRRCREETGCRHFMLGRGALANPLLAGQVARELGLTTPGTAPAETYHWPALLRRLIAWMEFYERPAPRLVLARSKQWLNLAGRHGNFGGFEAVKRAQTVSELFASLECSDTQAAKMSATETVRPGKTSNTTVCAAV